MKKQIKETCIRYIAGFLGYFFPIKKKIVFSSFFGKQYSCNPRAISEYMHEIYPDYEIVWLLNSKEDKYKVIPSYVRIVTPNDGFFSQGKEISSAFCFVYNCELKPNSHKKKNQLFIQTWHGDRGFKKILYNKYENEKCPITVYDNKLTDICMSGSSFGTENYRTAFRYTGEIMQLGNARNEKMLLLSENEKCLIKSKIGIEDGIKILIYAPTFRDMSQNKQEVMVDLNRVLSVLEERGDKWICLVRAHLASRGLAISENSKCIDVSAYPDMTDLLAISDMLLTDYSSSCCDFLLTSKPVILTIFDKEEYEKSSRSFIAFPKDTGFITVSCQEELENAIRNLRYEDYIESYAKVNQFFGTTETGNATKEVCIRINDFYNTHFKKG